MSTKHSALNLETKSQPNADLDELIREAKNNNIKVELVESKQLRDYAGMNWLAAKSLGYPIPENTIWIDKSLNRIVARNTLRHELEESKLMEGGKTYWEAHQTALAREKGQKPVDLPKPTRVVRVIKLHGDGDKTVVFNKKMYVLTTEGQTFKQTKRPRGLRMDVIKPKKNFNRRRRTYFLNGIIGHRR